MKRLGIVALSGSLAILVAQLLQIDEPHLAFVAIMPMLLFAYPVLLKQGSSIATDQHRVGRALLALVLLLMLFPFAFLHSPDLTRSTWKEVGILLSGQYKTFMVFLALPMVIAAAIVSRTEGE